MSYWEGARTISTGRTRTIGGGGSRIAPGTTWRSNRTSSSCSSIPTNNKTSTKFPILTPHAHCRRWDGRICAGHSVRKFKFTRRCCGWRSTSTTNTGRHLWTNCCGPVPRKPGRSERALRTTDELIRQQITFPLFANPKLPIAIAIAIAIAIE